VRNDAQQSIDICYRPGPQQQTRRSGVRMTGQKRWTDGSLMDHNASDDLFSRELLVSCCDFNTLLGLTVATFYCHNAGLGYIVPISLHGVTPKSTEHTCVCLGD